jgi:glycosidase
VPTVQKPVIYQLVVRYFGNINTTNQRNGTLATNGCGRFADVNDAAIDAIKRLGATHIWLTGCLRHATLTDYSSIGLPADDPNVMKGIAGSFYAVRDYFDVSPDYSADPAQRMAEFEALVERIHRAGMKVLIDFVPNHVARGYASVVRPELDFGRGDDQSQFFARDNHFFYLTGTSLRLKHPPLWDPPGVVFDGQFAPEDGGPGRTPKVTGDNCASPSPSVDNWYETVKLNYGYNFIDGSREFDPRPRTWDQMDQILAFWQSRGVDGFRCDMSHLVPREAWQFLIAGARDAGRDPNCFFLAEAYAAGGPGAPVDDLNELLDAGFDAVYHSFSYDALKRIYQGCGDQDDYDWAVTSLTRRPGWLAYLENHDERRLASPVVVRRGDGNPAGPGDSGFGTPDAGYQLAPLQFLFGNGPVLLFNAQEVGEPGAGAEGFSSADGRTTTFDYWCMREFTGWVNGHTYDGGQLADSAVELRDFYAALLALCQDPAVRGDGYWGLKYFNRNWRYWDCPDDLYSFARFQTGAGRLLVVAANFRPHAAVAGALRIPAELAKAANLAAEVSVRLVLDRAGAQDVVLARQTRESLVETGFSVALPNQSSAVFAIE